MPGSGSDIVTVGNRAALLQYQTSAEDGVCPPGLPSAACLSYLGRRRGGGGGGEADYLPLDGLPAASRRPVAGALPNWGCGTTVGEKYRILYPSTYQCGPTEGEVIVGSDWFILEIVGCLPSAITHHA